ncbi:MAG TPA: hypothetical protein VHT03_11865 [Rhizomicrobium sp.]|jgi:hypothetical protein|nr:hypothetical protein [Rhizomicrobium sp.]
MAENSLFICIRIPKSGSESLVRGLEAAFAGQRIFYVPNTLDPDSRVSRLQRLRFLRARYQNLSRRYGTVSMRAVWARIEREASAGSLLMGGHIDFRAAAAHLSRPLKVIAILREPIERARSEYDYMRHGYVRKHRFNRFDASVLHKRAGRFDFDSYLDFLFAHRGVYGDIACQYIGWDGIEELSSFFARHVFHCGALEKSSAFASALSEKLGRPFSLPCENRTVGERPAITARQRALLEQIYAHDAILYDWVHKNY